MMDGRVKTLHPKVHGGLLSIRDNATHDKACAEHGIQHIDMVCVNLYPFQATVAKGSDFPTCIENVDIGGPAMIRSGSKNHNHVTVLTDPSQYAKVIEELRANAGATTLKTRRSLAAAAYAKTAAYDSAIANWFAAQNDETPAVMTRAYELGQCECTHACVHACMYACVRACVRACMYFCVYNILHIRARALCADR